MRGNFIVVIFLVSYFGLSQDIQIVDSLDRSPIPFATISFGNGLGTFADEEGRFSFSKRKYADIDSLFVSSMGFADKAVKIDSTLLVISLTPAASQLSEIIVSAPKEGKFRSKKQKAETHTDIFACWLPTVESEVAVLFERFEKRVTQISKLYLPINAESQYKSKGKGKFATIFRIQYYENQSGVPGNPIPYENIVFSIDEKQDKVFELDVLSKSLFIPENGIFVSLQVLGYADDNGKLVDSKKYREVKTSRGIQKISTSFRPLLPFVKGLPNESTFVRRIFLNNRKWQVFDRNYNKNSKLVQTGHKNYGMGAEFKVWE
ncbi:carboxypeptidase-like regulatory domain-containing protein [Maribacter halichondriae]|uniref:carboxypeptidase-like regulatory domain-containing protein n=1 Tax=Maribacter halichondriae TaxID=2980554 RepID=UPI00235938A5|nr:carboxypeptidase-like regulatory domain-containing protein [Maribacter sp. Hal144]